MTTLIDTFRTFHHLPDLEGNCKKCKLNVELFFQYSLNKVCLGEIKLMNWHSMLPRQVNWRAALIRFFYIQKQLEKQKELMNEIQRLKALRALDKPVIVKPGDKDVNDKTIDPKRPRKGNGQLRKSFQQNSSIHPRILSP